MKANKFKYLAVAAAVGLFVAPSVPAGETVKADNYRKGLASVPVLDMPVQAAAIVSKAADQDKETVAAAVVQSAVALNPSAAAAVVSAISRSVPSAAAKAAASAAAAQPRQAAIIAKAAAAAAPAQAGSIVTAVCRELPSRYVTVCVAVSEAVPSAKQQIIDAAMASVPASFQRSIKKAQATAGQDASVAAVMEQSATLLQQATAQSVNLSSSASSQPKAPVIEQPYTPLPTTVTEMNPSQTHEQTGPRDYSNP